MEKPSVSDLREKIKKGVQNIQDYIHPDTDIITVIEEDHLALKDLMEVMKDDLGDYNARVKAFEEFVPLLLTHASAEEKTLYELMKTKMALRRYAYEGEVEHGIADQLCEEIKRSTRPNEIIAKIKVLAEMVDHHIEEEENDIFPDVRDTLNESELQMLMISYVREVEEFIKQGQTDTPSEKELTERPQ